MSIKYINDKVRLIADAWATLNDIDAKELLEMHIEEVFKLKEIEVINAVNHEDFLTLTLQNKIWKLPKEFSILDDGSLVWNRD